MGYLYCESQCFGNRIEQWVLKQLQARGWAARLLPQFQDWTDIIVDGVISVPVEVKGARARLFRRYRGGPLDRIRYSWNVSRIAKTDMVVVLIALDQAGVYHPFIIPSWFVQIRRVSVIHLASDPAAYAGRGRGWMAEFYQRWETINEVMNVRHRFNQTGQLTLWGQTSPDRTMRPQMSPY